jgi:tetratricopeptide (TPR) repeat protein
VARHAAYYSAWLAEQESGLKSASQKAVVAAIMAEIANVRGAWQWACAHQDAMALYRMIPTLDWFYEVRGWYIEAAPAFAQGMQAVKPLALAPDASEATQVCYWLLFGREGFHMLRRNPAFAVARLHDSVAELRRVSQHGEQIHCIKGLAYVNMFAGNYVEAQALLEEAREISVARGDNWNLALVLVIRGALEVLRSEAQTAQQHLDEALVVARAVGDPRPISTALVYKSVIALSVGASDEAERGCREALVLAAEQQDRFQMSLGLQVLGRIALAKNEHAEAEWLLNESLAIARDISDRWLEAQALGCLGALAAQRGDLRRAREQCRAALEVATRAPQPIALDQLAALAELELNTRPEAALTALAYVWRHPLTRPATRAAVAARWAEVVGAASLAQAQAAEAAAQQLPIERPAALLELFPRL